MLTSGNKMRMIAATSNLEPIVNRYAIASTAALLLLLAGCKEEAPPPVAKKAAAAPVPDLAEIKIENSSPDQAIKSYWKLMEVREREMNESCKKVGSHLYKTSLMASKITQGDIHKALTHPARCEINLYKREIKEVKTETETRAIVFAQLFNVTPVPEGATATQEEKERREKGVSFKYVLEKSSEGWKVDNVYELSSYSKEWGPVLTYQIDDNPSYPMFVFGLQ